MQSIREVIGEIKELPEPMLVEVLQFVRFLGGLFSAAAPLDLKSGELALTLLHQIDFFLVIRAPEISVNA